MHLRTFFGNSLSAKIIVKAAAARKVTFPITADDQFIADCMCREGAKVFTTLKCALLHFLLTGVNMYILLQK
jgi:hypothetical protein